MTDTYHVDFGTAPKREVCGCIDLVESHDDGGWYAQQYDFKRSDSATRTSSKIYRTREALVRALDIGSHRWKAWS